MAAARYIPGMGGIYTVEGSWSLLCSRPVVPAQQPLNTKEAKTKVSNDTSIFGQDPRTQSREQMNWSHNSGLSLHPSRLGSLILVNLKTFVL